MTKEVTAYTDYLLESEMYSRFLLLIFCYQKKKISLIFHFYFFKLLPDIYIGAPSTLIKMLLFSVVKEVVDLKPFE